ncbi:cell division protein ZapA [Sphingomonas bacterium]|uniref:cell division protein ZapA n=1 Tax=Sphingomonas bacterium TaxID=1895847 RepID=UPI00157622F7|nr:cell division protein ZapA [Sphingomonas bacterium]
MAEVVLQIGDRRHSVTCRDGEEAQVRHLGGLLDQRWAAANRAAGSLSGERAMLFVALMLADALEEAENRPPEPGAASPAMLEKLADRLEGLASALEQSPPSA